MDRRIDRRSKLRKQKAKDDYQFKKNDLFVRCRSALIRLSGQLARIPESRFSGLFEYEISDVLKPVIFGDLSVLVTAVIRFADYANEYGLSVSDIISDLTITDYNKDLTFSDIISMLDFPSTSPSSSDQQVHPSTSIFDHDELDDEEHLQLLTTCNHAYCGHHSCMIRRFQSADPNLIEMVATEMFFEQLLGTTVITRSATIHLNRRYAEEKYELGPEWEAAPSLVFDEVPMFQARRITNDECRELRCAVNHVTPLDASATVQVSPCVIGIYSGPGNGKSVVVSALRQIYRRVFDTDHLSAGEVIPPASVLISNRIDIINKCSTRIYHLPCRNAWIRRCMLKCGDRVKLSWYDDVLSSIRHPCLIIRSNEYLSKVVQFVYETRKYPDP